MSNIFESIEKGDIESFKNFLSKKNCPNWFIDEKGSKYSTLMYAAKYGNIEMCEILLKNGKSMNHFFKNAVCNVNIIKNNLMFETDTISKCKVKTDALFCACRFNHLDVVKFFASYNGGIPFSENKNKLNAAHVAVIREYTEIFNFLKDFITTEEFFANDKNKDHDEIISDSFLYQTIVFNNSACLKIILDKFYKGKFLTYKHSSWTYHHENADCFKILKPYLSKKNLFRSFVGAVESSNIPIVEEIINDVNVKRPFYITNNYDVVLGNLERFRKSIGNETSYDFDSLYFPNIFFCLIGNQRFSEIFNIIQRSNPLTVDELENVRNDVGNNLIEECLLEGEKNCMTEFLKTVYPDQNIDEEFLKKYEPKTRPEFEGRSSLNEENFCCECQDYHRKY